jgi:hypothetical protein
VHSYAGEYPGEWDYAGAAHALPQLPPEVGVVQADGDRRAAGCQPRAVAILAT